MLVTIEISSHAKISELADVIRGFAKELRSLGHDVRIAMPFYHGSLAQTHTEELIPILNVSLGVYSHYANILKHVDDLYIYLVQQDFYFGRSNIYGYLDDYERFIFFSRAVLEML